MNELQECQFKIFKEFIRLCEENNLTYFLIGGSCLGAIRHKGFIPWDDDIDVALPREDYNKFIALQDQIKKPYFIQTYKSDPNYTYNYAKIRDCSTTFIENYFVNHDFNHGVWIDIFPLDGMSLTDVENREKLGKMVDRSWRNAFLCYLPALKRKTKKETWFKDILLNIVGFSFSLLNLKHYRNKKVDKTCEKIPYNEAYLVGNLLGTNAKKQAMPRDVFGEGVYVDFENIKAKVPTQYDLYLKTLFNDYMKYPPLKDQEGHHHHKGLDLHLDYITYKKKNHI